MPRRENIKHNTYYMHCLSVVLKTRSIGYDSHQQGFMYLKGISLNKQKSTSSSFRAPPFKSPKKIQGVLLDGYADDERHHYHPGDQSLCLAPWFLKSIGGIDLQVSILTLTYPEALESTY